MSIKHQSYPADGPVPQLHNLPDGCVICGNDHPQAILKACSRCKGHRRYCHTSCQTLDWKNFNHKHECADQERYFRIAEGETVNRNCGAGDASTDVAAVMLEDATNLKEKANACFNASKQETQFHAKRSVIHEALKGYSAAKLIALAALHRARLDARSNALGDKQVAWAIKEGSIVLATLEARCMRLAAIAAVNMAIALRCAGEYELSAGKGERSDNDQSPYSLFAGSIASAMEGRRIDPTYALKALKAEECAYKKIFLVRQERSRLDKYHLDRLATSIRAIELGVKQQGAPCALLCANVISSSKYKRLEAARFESILVGPAAEARGILDKYLPIDLPVEQQGDFWGQASLTASLVPVRDAQWLSVSLYGIAGQSGSWNSLFMSAADSGASGDSIEVTKDAATKGGKAAYGGTKTAVLNSKRIIMECIQRIEQAGIAVRTLTLGAGLFNLGQGEPLALEIRSLPGHCILLTSPSHNALNVLVELRELRAQGYKVDDELEQVALDITQGELDGKTTMITLQAQLKRMNELMCKHQERAFKENGFDDSDDE